MSTYVREKVLRIPMERINMDYIKNIIAQKYPNEDHEDDFSWYLESVFPDIFDYRTVNKFQIAPTEESYIDYVLEYELDADGEYGKTRALYESEKVKYMPAFQKIDPNINMDFVRLVEFCWYNGCEAPDYYDDEKDLFYDEI
jgi:hypothetical protein